MYYAAYRQTRRCDTRLQSSSTYESQRRGGERSQVRRWVDGPSWADTRPCICWRRRSVGETSGVSIWYAHKSFSLNTICLNSSFFLEDKNLIVWDLYPQSDLPTPSPAPADPNPRSLSPPSTKQPTALVIPFAHTLHSVTSHPSSNKEFVVADSRGCVFLVDWRRDPEDVEEEVYGYHCLVELIHPRALADAATGLTRHVSACASWRTDNANM